MAIFKSKVLVATVLHVYLLNHLSLDGTILDLFHAGNSKVGSLIGFAQFAPLVVCKECVRCKQLPRSPIEDGQPNLPTACFTHGHGMCRSSSTHWTMASWHHGIMFFDFRGYQVAGKRMKKLPPRKKKINRIPRIPPLKAKSHLTWHQQQLFTECEHRGIRINGFDPYRHRYHMKYIQISCANRCEIHFQMVGACRFYKGIICTRRVPIDIPDPWICSQTLPWLLDSWWKNCQWPSTNGSTYLSNITQSPGRLVWVMGLSENSPPPV